MPKEEEYLLETPWTFWYDKKQKKPQQGYFTASYENYAHLELSGVLGCILPPKRPSSIEEMLTCICSGVVEYSAHVEAFPRGVCWLLKIRKEVHIGGSTKHLGAFTLVFADREAFESLCLGLSLAIRKLEDVVCLWNADNRNVDIQMMSSKLGNTQPRA